MKKIVSIFAVVSLFAMTSCIDMNLPSKNKVSDDDLMGSASGMSVYMARLYSYLPIEAFKYEACWGIPYRQSFLGSLGTEGTGEAISREDQLCGSFTGEDYPYWDEAYMLIRDANHLIETLPNYKSNYAEVQYNEFIGEGYFVRAMVFMQLARRFGGVPLVTKQIQYDPDNHDSMEVPRSSEEETWEQILSDFNKAIELLPVTPTNASYANKYVALAYKSEAMLYAACVAKYNETVSGRLTGIGEKSGKRVIGFDEGKAASLSLKWFREAYDASLQIIKSGKYSLYKKYWSANDKDAQYKNMCEMWRDESSAENIFVKQYLYPTMTHGFDAYSSPYYWHLPLAGGTCPTLDYVELFEGIPTYDDGTFRTTDGTGPGDGEYVMYDNPYDAFKDVEPRLRAYVILPWDTFRDSVIKVRAGIYTGQAPFKPLFDDYSYNSYPTTYTGHSEYKKTLFVSPSPTEEVEVTLKDGSKMIANGSCGPWYAYGESTINGFHIRKYLDPDKTVADIGEGKSDQHFILMRYGEVLLNAAEAAVEIAIAGGTAPEGEEDLLVSATKWVNEIRERAGATLLSGNLSANNDGRDIVRTERRKELAFEHKSKYDTRRWRVIHEEGREGFWGIQKDKSGFSKGTSYMFRGLFPFYCDQTEKYFFDIRRTFALIRQYNYNIVDYYFPIPSDEVASSKYIDQQPNR